MRRAPWWAGGRFRAVRRRLPRHYDDLPLWARLGFMTPLQTSTLVWLVAIGCAALGAASLATAILIDRRAG